MPFLLLVAAIFFVAFLKHRATGTTYLLVAIGAIAASLWQSLG